MVKQIRLFFNSIRELWAETPGYVKVFLYSTTSYFVGMYLSDQQIDTKTVVYILAINLGLYQVPKEIGKRI